MLNVLNYFFADFSMKCFKIGEKYAKVYLKWCNEDQ